MLGGGLGFIGLAKQFLEGLIAAKEGAGSVLHLANAGRYLLERFSACIELFGDVVRGLGEAPLEGHLLGLNAAEKFFPALLHHSPEVSSARVLKSNETCVARLVGGFDLRFERVVMRFDLEFMGGELFLGLADTLLVATVSMEALGAQLGIELLLGLSGVGDVLFEVVEQREGAMGG